KIATGLVSSVWLQLGSDTAALRKGLDFVRIETEGRSPPIRVIGSVVIPSRKFLAMMKFRPWSGVRLSETYLSSVEEANKATKAILNVYKAYGVEPIVESAVKNEADLEQVKNLLGDLYGSSPTSSSSSSKSVGVRRGVGAAALGAAIAGGGREGGRERGMEGGRATRTLHSAFPATPTTEAGQKRARNVSGGGEGGREGGRGKER
ncbi:hypothetical protein VYU27_010401, partial [Nannochloropsis oceanica]